MSSIIKVVLADDHNLVRNAIANLINSYESYKVVAQFDNGEQLIGGMPFIEQPDIVLLDINMPKVDGYAVCLWLRENYPGIKVLALSMYDKEHAIIRILRNGARGYILKDIEPREFKIALDTLVSAGYYYSGIITGRLIHAINSMDSTVETMQLVARVSPHELSLLELICTDLTYKEIADKLNINPRTLDSQREILFDKLNVKSRVGLAIQAIRLGLVNID